MDSRTPSFIKVSGYYTMEPVKYMHLWNQCEGMREVAEALRASWKEFAGNNVLVPSKSNIC